MSSPPVVVIDSRLAMEKRVELLLEALSQLNTNREQTIEICADIDLTGYTGIEIWDNRSLIAAASCRRSARRLGPRIFVRDERNRSPLFLIAGDNVLVSGFRLEGPTSGIGYGDRHEIGIKISPPAKDGAGSLLPAVKNIEICNMEIFHWSGAGIQVTDNALAEDRRELKGRLFKTNPAAVRIRQCYFHDNRHGPGEGYGVESTAGAYALIEQNVFNENRHAIAGGSRPRNKKGRPPVNEKDYSGYTARDNLILDGGGLHCNDSQGTYGGIGLGLGALAGGLVGALVGFAVGGPPGALAGAEIGVSIGGVVGAGVGAYFGGYCFYTHQIDMHGDKNAWYSRHNWQVGTAGETIIIERNTILYTNGLAIKIRGNPLDKAVVDNNVFRHKTRADAIDQNGDQGFGDNVSNPIQESNNVFDCGDLTAEVAEGDFGQHTCGTIDLGHGRFDEEARTDVTSEVSDGFTGGHQDDFMATGVTWWAQSRRTGQWRYLNTMKEKLPELQFGKFDDDDIWDVALHNPHPEWIPVETYSKSGTGPWISRNVIHP